MDRSDGHALAAFASGNSLPEFPSLAAAAWTLEPPAPHERRAILRDEAGRLLDALLARVARGRGALDVAIGDGLATLAQGQGLLRLGYVQVGDYARERLGIAASTAEKMARLAARLRDRPVLREAVWRGEVSARKAEVVVEVARGDAEAAWVDQARNLTVRALEAAVSVASAARSAGAALAIAADDDERWERVALPLTPEGGSVLKEAMDLAARVLGATAPRWQRLEALCQEFLGSFAPPDDADLDGAADLVQPPGWLEEVKEAVEVEFHRWDFLDVVGPVRAPELPPDAAVDARSLDAELRRLAAMRAGWDELVGHLAMLLRMLGLWRDMGFVSFGHYCTERLGMAERTVEQRAWLERKLHELPPLRAAMRAGRLSYEQARLVAGRADAQSIDAWIARAEGMTCIALRRAIESDEDAALAEAEPATQMCASAPVLDLRMPVRVGSLLRAAFKAARAAAGRWLTSSECLEALARHFLATWGSVLAGWKPLHRRVLERDHGFCQAPGCSRSAVQAHHVVFRSHGGPDTAANLTSLCAAHHLHGVHDGHLRVAGAAPDALVWSMRAPPAPPSRIALG